MPGVPVREIGESEWLDGGWCCGMRPLLSAFEGYAAGNEACVGSEGAPWVLCQSSSVRQRQHMRPNLFLLLAVLASSLDPVPTLDYISLETDRPRPAVQLEEEPAGIAEHRSVVVAPPQRRRARRAILADGLEIVSDGCGHYCYWRSIQRLSANVVIDRGWVVEGGQGKS
jgi:hypothetical protein